MHIFKKDFRKFSRSGMEVFFAILFPVILIYVLGSLLAGLYESDPPIGEIKIHYFMAKKGEELPQEMTSFFKEVEADGLINVEQTYNLEVSKELMKASDLDVVVELIAEPIEILIHEGNDYIKNSTVEAIFKGYSQTHKVISDIASFDHTLLGDIEVSRESFVDKENSTMMKGFSIMNYYGVVMILMTLFLTGAISTTNHYFYERKEKTIIRFFGSPKNQLLIFMQSTFAALPVVLIQVFVTAVVCIVFYDVEYCSSWQGNVLLFSMIIIVGLATTAVGHFIGLFLKIDPVAIVMPFCWIILFYSGIFSKEIYIEGFSNYLPPYLVQQAAFDLTLFGDSQSAIITIIVSLIVFVSFTLLGSFVFIVRREKA